MRVYIKKSFSLVLVFLFCMLSFSLPVHAATPVYTCTFPFSEPQVTDNSGYLTFLVKDGSSYWVGMMTWSYYQQIYVNPNGTDSGHIYYDSANVDVNVTSDKITLTPQINTTYDYHSWHVTRYIQSGGYSIVRNQSLVEGQPTSASYNPSGEIVSYQVFGNFGNVSSELSSPLPMYSIVWSDDYSSYNKLLDILNMLGDIYFIDDTISNQIDDALDVLSDIWLNTEDIDASINNLISKLVSHFNSLSNQLNSDFQGLFDDNDIIIGLLEDILSELRGTGDDNLEDLPDESINDVLDQEENLIGGHRPSDDMQNIDIAIDSSAQTTIWNIINNFVNCHPLVFSFYLTILSLGVISLILNR